MKAVGWKPVCPVQLTSARRAIRQATDSMLKLFLSGVPGSYCCIENNGNVFIL